MHTQSDMLHYCHAVVARPGGRRKEGVGASCLVELRPKSSVSRDRDASHVPPAGPGRALCCACSSCGVLLRGNNRRGFIWTCLRARVDRGSAGGMPGPKVQWTGKISQKYPV
jgi:hypothetical protein